jgi:tetratricopeptide (TPR) repeat protein
MVRDHHSRAINLTFRIAIGLFESLRLHGINYVVDPQTPYEDYSRDATVVDYVQFPSQTLEYRAGDCDDLSILYSTLLESIGTESAFITVPGHIYMAFSLGMTPGEAERLFWDTDDLIFKDEQTWVPVEVTMVQKGFLQAWEMGAKQWRKHDPEGTAGFYPIHEAWREYEPVGLSGTGSGSSFPPHEIVMEYYANAVSNFVEREIADRVVVLEQQIVESRNPAPLQNKIGVMYARYGILDKAKTFFEEAAKSGYTPAMINLGNILYLDRKFDRALEYFDRAHESRPGMPAALVGIAKVNHELENYGTVRKVYTELQQRSPETAAKYSYLVSGSVAKGRASALMDQEKVMWSEEQ